MKTNTFTLSKESINTINEGLKLLHEKYCKEYVRKLKMFERKDIAVQFINNKLENINEMIGLFNED